MNKTKDLTEKFIKDIDKKVKAFTFIVNYELSCNEKELAKLKTLAHKLWSSIKALRAILKDKESEYRELESKYNKLRKEYEELQMKYIKLSTKESGFLNSIKNIFKQ